jgi:hypothetical protein
VKIKRKPKLEEKIYLPTSLYIGHGRDDFQGGIATINKIETSNDLPKDHFNYTMVGVKERPGFMTNWLYILENQKEWAKEYKGQIAHPDPDYNSYDE